MTPKDAVDAARTLRDCADKGLLDDCLSLIEVSQLRDICWHIMVDDGREE